MDLGISKNVAPLLEEVSNFIVEEIYPVEQEFMNEISVGDRWQLTDRQSEILDSVKSKARAKGLVLVPVTVMTTVSDVAAPLKIAFSSG